MHRPQPAGRGDPMLEPAVADGGAVNELQQEPVPLGRPLPRRPAGTVQGGAVVSRNPEFSGRCYVAVEAHLAVAPSSCRPSLGRTEEP